MHKESLSALLDGECSKEEIDSILNALDNSPQLREHWSRLCLGREAGRGLQCKTPDLGLADRVRAALAADPAANAEPQLAAPVVVNARRWQPLTGLALAATVAGVAVITAWFRQSGAPAEVPQAVAAVPAALATAGSMGMAEGPGLQQVALTPEPLVTKLQTDPTMNPEMARQIENYLTEYNNYRALQGMGGTFGYARFAAHQAVYQPEDNH